MNKIKAFNDNMFGEEEQFDDSPMTTDTKTVKEELKKFSDERQSNSIIGDNHTRMTYLISDSTLSKLDDLVAYIEASNGLHSELTKGLDEREVNRNRTLTKGTRSKALNFALQHFLDTWEQQEGLIPQTEHKKYKVDKVYHNAYRFTKDGVTYGITQSNRGVELYFMSTADGYTKQQIDEWFDSIEDESKREGRPRKK